MDPYQSFANAIVISAFKDYRKAYKRYLRRLHLTDEKDSDLLELESFFRSAWYQTLTSIDGEYLMERLRQEVSA